MLRDYEISQRRACVLIGVDPKTVRRDRPPDHRAIRDAMKDVAGKRRRFGYRRIGVMLERQGMIMNHKKLYRLYREEGLSVRRRRGRKRARGSRTPMPVPMAPGARWSMDFVSEPKASAATPSARHASSGFWLSMMIATGRICAWLATPAYRAPVWRVNSIRWYGRARDEDTMPPGQARSKECQSRLAEGAFGLNRHTTWSRLPGLLDG